MLIRHHFCVIPTAKRRNCKSPIPASVYPLIAMLNLSLANFNHSIRNFVAEAEKSDAPAKH
jgi:hypothetical protein